jgi:hypothetical protein
MKLKPIAGVLLLLLVAAAGCVKKPAVRALPPVLTAPGGVVFAGVRSSHYGIKPFPQPAAWEKAIKTMAGHFEGSTPCAIWIVGELKRPKDVHLFFPGNGKTYPHIEFDTVDQHEAYLTAFDQAGIKVFLQVEPANADMGTLIDLVLGRYGQHPCVIGFGVDVEWHREADNPSWGVKIDDSTAREWEAKVKSYNQDYRLFLKHWDRRWMPPNFRGEIIFVDDSQIFKRSEDMVSEFVNDWANYFYPSLVVFQVGYKSDKPWWEKMVNPPQNLGEEIWKRVKQRCAFIWVDFSLRDVLPLSENEDHGKE